VIAAAATDRAAISSSRETNKQHEKRVSWDNPGHKRETNKQNPDKDALPNGISIAIRLRAGWVAVIIAPLARLPAMDNRHRRMVGGNRPVTTALAKRGGL
jgi:hypothetical protein